jgi:hypothetical protein
MGGTAMAELIVMVCLLATPEQCSEKEVPGAGAGDVVSCIKQAGDKANEWQKSNSEYFLIGWRCEKKG